MFLYFKINIIKFQSPATPIMEGIVDLHNYIFFYLILIFVFIVWMFVYILYSFYFIPTYCYDVVFSEIRLRKFYKYFFPIWNLLLFEKITVREVFEFRKYEVEILEVMKMGLLKNAM